MAPSKNKPAAPLPTIRRLPAYLRLLRRHRNAGEQVISGTTIAGEFQVEPIQVRKDLACTGAAGKPRVGFEIEPTIEAIEKFLGWDNLTQAFLVGAGHLGSALLGYEGFRRHGLEIVAGFDTDPAVVGRTIDGTEIFALDRLASLARRMSVRVAVLTVPSTAAQEVTDLLVDAGIVGIWNFSGRKLAVPEDVIVQYEDLSAGLAVLTSRVNDLLHPSSTRDAKA
ncbi:MAG: redox-sensing transcriptional repressor Rex [Phycisphaerae bacterium]